ncbi:MAG: type II/IV secretion system protein, partial [Nitrospirae bacterium]|nr:type II/IV secretion system protein [Nitrospirota bacterium]
QVTVAMVDPLNIFALDDLQRMTGLEALTVVSTEQDVVRAIDRYYGVTASMEEVVREHGLRTASEREEIPAVGLETAVEDTPVVRLVNMVIHQAVRAGASDIHVEPDPDVLRVRYRVDGILREVMAPPKTLHPGVVSRIKIMSNLDISEKRVPQDGRVQLKVGEKEIDLRVSTLPTIFGEKVVMRILDKSGILLGLEEMALAPEVLGRVRKYIRRPHGLILVTGPTGSGKTTTLYAALNEINSPEKNLVTIEDPVEYQIKGINQIPVNTAVGVTFASGLRSILRQDPDVVMVGEIRDAETATIAIQAALTGHLVFSTLHTNDAPGAVARLVDMGVEPFLAASSLMMVLAQRLVRKVCPRCRKPLDPDPDLLRELGITRTPEMTFVEGEGCQDCRGLGYSGRIGVYELLEVDETIRKLIVGRVSSGEIRSAALKSGFIPLREDGFRKASRGMTTLEEVLRVAREDEG